MIDRPRVHLNSSHYARLVEASRILNSTSELEQLLQFIIREAAALTDAEAASIMLYNPDTRELQFKAVSQEADERLSDFAVPLDNSVAGTVFTTNRPLIIEDAAADPRWHPTVDRMMEYRTVSILGVPMHDASARAVGVLEALNKRDGKQFDAADVETLSTLADLAGVAVERARLVDALQTAYRQLNELDQLKSSFIALASHELRTPLSIILGFVSGLRDRADDPETAQQLDSVMHAAVRLRSLIQDMLNLQYVDRGEGSLDKEAFDLVSFVRETVTARDDMAEAKQLEIQLTLPSTPLPVFADRGAMELVLSNLLNNAVKFTPQGGTVVVAAERRGSEAWLRVKDSGIGIPRERIDQIFTRFYQVELPLSRHYEGLGLGLAVARDLLEAQEGRIWADSNEGQGSEFFVALPLATQGRQNRIEK